MNFLITGLLLFTLVHLYPSLFVTNRDKLVERLGRNAYRGLFSVVILAALVLIVVGWRASTPRRGASRMPRKPATPWRPSCLAGRSR